MRILCLDLESVLVPEIWIAVAEAMGIPELRRTTRDEPDYDTLMRFRLELLRERGITLGDIQGVIARMEPLEGAAGFLAALRARAQVVLLSDTFEEFASPLMERLGRPALLCNRLEVGADGIITGYRLRQVDGKRRAVAAFRSMGLTVFAAGDSFNDVSMIREADDGCLFRPPREIRGRAPGIDCVDDYEGFAARIERFLRGEMDRERDDGEAAADAARAFGELYGAVVRLRAPDGCPWDREATPESLRQDLIEETYECVEAIGEGDREHVSEEIGDVVFVAALIARIYEQEGGFTMGGALRGLTDKVVRRHPHVFGGVRVRDSAEVLRNWERIKVEQEGRRPRDSALDGVAKGLPPLERAAKLSARAAKAGFDWDDRAGVVAKVREELAEVEAAATPDALEDELGDVLYVAANLCRHCGVDPDAALLRANAKFTRRFRHVEARMRESGTPMDRDHREAMERFWQEAKSLE